MDHPPTIESSQLTGPQLGAVTEAVVRVFAQDYGRGPIEARSQPLDHGLVTVLEDCLTNAERTVLGSGKLAPIVAMREAFEQAVSGRLIRTVEEITGRRVIAHRGQMEFDPPACFLFFAFEQD